MLFGISFPRYSKRTLSAMKYARDRGARVIALTDSQLSPLARVAGDVLLARSDMASFVDSLVAPLSVINALIVAVGMSRRDEIEQTFNKLERIWEEYDVYEKPEDEQLNIIVIGGGAAGLMAAGTAAEQGAQVTLLETNEKVGRKLFITGKGRCNCAITAMCRRFCATCRSIRAFCIPRSADSVRRT